MKLQKQLKLLLLVSRIYASASRRFSVQGLGLGDFLVLHYLAISPDQKMRPVDLAEKLGMTASGVTRILLPMEKIGLIKRLTEKQDGRVSYAALASSGKRILEESLERAELLSEEICLSSKSDLEEVLEILQKLA